MLLHDCLAFTGVDGHILIPKTGAPDREDASSVILTDRMVVDMVAKVEIVAGTTWEQNSINLGKLLIGH